jgi:hypothetical protein
MGRSCGSPGGFGDGTWVASVLSRPTNARSSGAPLRNRASEAGVRLRVSDGTRTRDLRRDQTRPLPRSAARASASGGRRAGRTALASPADTSPDTTLIRIRADPGERAPWHPRARTSAGVTRNEPQVAICEFAGRSSPVASGRARQFHHDPRLKIVVSPVRLRAPPSPARRADRAGRSSAMGSGLSRAVPQPTRGVTQRRADGGNRLGDRVGAG